MALVSPFISKSVVVKQKEEPLGQELYEARNMGCRRKRKAARKTRRKTESGLLFQRVKCNAEDEMANRRENQSISPLFEKTY